MSDVKTSKPISTISFNSSDYLELKLNDLLRAGIISYWTYIEHIPEPDVDENGEVLDEAGGKVHYHVYVEPSRMIQTDDLRRALLEPDPDNSKPKGCLMWTSSKWDDWYLYALHDAAYLAAKGLSRVYHYRDGDMHVSDDDDYRYKVRQIDRLAVSPYARMQDAILSGSTWDQYVSRGLIPIPQLMAYKLAWHTLASTLLRPEVVNCDEARLGSAPDSAGGHDDYPDACAS